MAIPRFILDKQGDISAMCRRTHARRLDLFGSATRGDFNPGSSDLDFLVTFEPLPPADYSDSFFALKEGLEALFHRPVDLLTERALRNPFLIRRVQAERVAVYGA
jgi:uncharacterized protein